MKFLSKSQHQSTNVALASVSFAQHIRTDYDTAQTLANTSLLLGKGPDQNPLLVDRIKSAVNSALAAKVGRNSSERRRGLCD